MIWGKLQFCNGFLKREEASGSHFGGITLGSSKESMRRQSRATSEGSRSLESSPLMIVRSLLFGHNPFQVSSGEGR